MNNKVSILFVAFTVVFASVIKAATLSENIDNSVTTLGGINCLVQTAFNVEDASNDFTYNIEVCNVDTSDEISSILDNCAKIIKITSKIIDFNDGVCENAAYNESEDTDIAPRTRCSSLMKTSVIRLDEAIIAATNDQSNLYDLSKIENSCSRIAASNLKLNLRNFANSIENCASLG